MKLPDLGQYLYVKIPEGIYKGLYDTRLQEIKKDYYKIDRLVDVQTRLVRVPHKGTHLLITFSDLDEKVPYTFESIVKINQADQILIEPPHHVHRNQRRDFVRVPVSLPVQILAVDMETQSVLNINGESRDLSGGGILVQIHEKEPLRQGDFVGLSFKVLIEQTSYQIETKAQVTRIWPSNAPISKNCGLKFVEMDEKNRKNIIQYVYHRQIELKDLKPDFSNDIIY